MTKVPPAAFKLDIYNLQTRLVWANARAVETWFLDSLAMSSARETVAWYLEEGSVEVQHGQRVTRAVKGEWIFLRAEDGHQHFTPGSRVMSLRFQLLFRGGKPLFARSKDRVIAGTTVPRLEESARALVAEYARTNSPGILFVARERLSLVENFRIEAAFMAWLGAYVETMLLTGEPAIAPDERDARVTKALQLIEDHRMRDKFSETELARRCGLSVNQLARLFRREQGVSPFQYYEGRRLELAQHALAESSLPVKEVAFELGFSSPPHFSNWFLDRLGASPRAWRVKVRAEATKAAATGRRAH
jgi:AraC-like DNA-binding protein